MATETSFTATQPSAVLALGSSRVSVVWPPLFWTHDCPVYSDSPPSFSAPRLRVVCFFPVLQYTAFRVYVLIVLPLLGCKLHKDRGVFLFVCLFPIYYFVPREHHGAQHVLIEYLWKEGRKEEREGGEIQAEIQHYDP